MIIKHILDLRVLWLLTDSLVSSLHARLALQRLRFSYCYTLKHLRNFPTVKNRALTGLLFSSRWRVGGPIPCYSTLPEHREWLRQLHEQTIPVSSWRWTKFAYFGAKIPNLFAQSRRQALRPPAGQGVKCKVRSSCQSSLLFLLTFNNASNI